MEKRRDDTREASRRKPRDEASLSVTFDENVEEIASNGAPHAGVDAEFPAGDDDAGDARKLIAIPGKKYYARAEADVEETPACFGVRSYLHHFYDTKVDTHVDVVDDVAEEDDFAYLVDLEKKQRRRSYRYCLSLWFGANLILLGLIAVLVGLLTPRREEVVAYHDDLKMLDRWAITFNERLDFCLKLGLLIFGVGNCVVFVTFVLMVCDGNSGCLKKPTEYRPTSQPPLDPESARASYPAGHGGGGGGGKIPLTEEITPVQPKGENLVVAAEKRFGSRAMQTPYY